MTQNETTLPFFLQSNRSDVVRAFGQPDNDGFGDSYGPYPDQGIVVEYNEHDLVRAIAVAMPDEGKSVKHKLLGLTLGDAKQSYLAKLGTPFKTVTYSWAQIMGWKIDNYWLKVEAWAENGDEQPWGPYRKGDIFEIEVRNELMHVFIDEDDDA